MQVLQLNYLSYVKQKLKEFNACDTRARKDKNKHEDGIIEFIKKGFICNRLKYYERENCVSISLG